jgi:hypothetical protein
VSDSLSAEAAENVCSYIPIPVGRKKRTVVRTAILKRVNPSDPEEQAKSGPTQCARCGKAIDPSDHFVVANDDGDERAYICRSEHIVAWVMRGAAWQLERPWEAAEDRRSATGSLRVVRVRAGQEIEREFESPEELRKWASAGAFWATD